MDITQPKWWRTVVRTYKTYTLRHPRTTGFVAVNKTPMGVPWQIRNERAGTVAYPNIRGVCRIDARYLDRVTVSIRFNPKRRPLPVDCYVQRTIEVITPLTPPVSRGFYDSQDPLQLESQNVPRTPGRPHPLLYRTMSKQGGPPFTILPKRKPRKTKAQRPPFRGVPLNIGYRRGPLARWRKY